MHSESSKTTTIRRENFIKIMYFIVEKNLILMLNS